MTFARRGISVAWPLVLLVLFLATFRRAERGAAAQAVGLDCEHPDAISLEACVAHDPTNSALLADLGAGYEASGRLDLAEGAYRRALTIDPRDGDLHVRLGELLLKRGDRPGAHAEAEAALRWHPGSARALGLAARSATMAAAVNDQ
jgi:cytochrome c-type biogenesis protein CcmH/NrfG